MHDVQVVILAAGLGTRLGRPLPKPLARLDDGRSIMQQQVDNLRQVFGSPVRITAVVGYKATLIMEEQPDLLFAYNADYDSTNTSKSLLRALRTSGHGGVLWLNGDVVFDPCVLKDLRASIGADRSTVCVNTAAVGDEEVKYTVDEDGYVAELSKTVVGGLGEAVGINFVAAGDKAMLIEELHRCDDGDYFERAIETAVQDRGMQVHPLDISSHFAVEVDFEEDLERANHRMAVA
jgi:CDP-glycerol glycerophosphotransferase